MRPGESRALRVQTHYRNAYPGLVSNRMISNTNTRNHQLSALPEEEFDEFI